MNLTDQFWEINLEHTDDFLKVKETLTRIGIRNKSSDTLFQQAHILHKAGRYYIVHFKQMFQLDGIDIKMKSSDYYRVARIAKMLYKWNLVSDISAPKFVPDVPLDDETNVKNSLFVVPFAQKHNWIIVEKYSIGGNPTTF